MHAEQLVAENSDPALVDSAILTAHRARAELNANTCLCAAGLTGDTRPPLEGIPQPTMRLVVNPQVQPHARVHPVSPV